MFRVIAALSLQSHIELCVVDVSSRWFRLLRFLINYSFGNRRAYAARTDKKKQPQSNHSHKESPPGFEFSLQRNPATIQPACLSSGGHRGRGLDRKGAPSCDTAGLILNCVSNTACRTRAPPWNWTTRPLQAGTEARSRSACILTTSCIWRIRCMRSHLVQD